MSNAIGFKPVRLILLSLLVCTAMFLLPDRASALVHLSGTHSAGEIKAKCGAAAGGVYRDGPDGTYSCIADQGSVACDKNGKCTGECNKCGAVVKGGVNGILRPPASAGTASAAGGTTNKHPGNNANQPVVSQRSGHSSGTKH